MEPSDVLIRDMRPEEAGSLLRTARRSFSPVEALGASRPKSAVVAEVDGAVAGAVFLKTIPLGGGRTLGYLDLGFVSRKHRGLGIGRRLYPAAAEKLRREGADLVGAMVKDDNAASWGLLADIGFHNCGYRTLLGELGPMGALRVWCKTLYFIGSGMEFWLDRPAPARHSGGELLWFFGLNLLLLLLRLGYVGARGLGFLWQETAAVLCTLLVGVLGGWVAARCTGLRNWQFRQAQGGLLLSAFLLTLGTCYPVLGRWYPAERENTHRQRRDMGLQALVEWLFLAAWYLAALLLLPDGLFRSRALQAGYAVLLYRILAFYPFEHFGGGRLLRWSKPLFAVAAAATAALLYLF